jgi:hypothetical protein
MSRRALPNQRLQRAGAPGSKVGWLVSAPEVMQVLCGRRAVARPLRCDSLASRHPVLMLELVADRMLYDQPACVVTDHG